LLTAEFALLFNLLRVESKSYNKPVNKEICTTMFSHKSSYKNNHSTNP